MKTTIKKTIIKYAINSILALAFITGPLMAGAQSSHALTGYGWNIKTTKLAYTTTEPVQFCLYNHSRIPFTYGPDENHWNITDHNGNIVYSPSSTPPSTPQPISFSPICESWNQVGNDGKEVKAGTYTIKYFGTPLEVTPKSFDVIKSENSDNGNHERKNTLDQRAERGQRESQRDDRSTNRRL